MLMLRLMRIFLPLVLLTMSLLGCQAAQEATATASPVAKPAVATPTKAPAVPTPTAPPEKPRRGGVFRAGFPSDVVTFDPAAPTTVMQHGMHAIYDKLIMQNQ